MMSMARNGLILSVIAWIMIWACWLAYGQFVYKANVFKPAEWLTVEELSNSTIRAMFNITF